MTIEEAIKIARKQFNARERKWYEIVCKRPTIRKDRIPSRALKWEDCEPGVQEAEVKKVIDAHSLET